MINRRVFQLPVNDNKLKLMEGMVLHGGSNNKTLPSVNKRNEDMFPTSTDAKVKTPPQPEKTKLDCYKQHNQKLYLPHNFIEGRVDVKLKKAESFQVRHWWNRHNPVPTEFEVEPNPLDKEECLLVQKGLKTWLGTMARIVWQEMYVEAAKNSEYDWLKKRSDGQLVQNWYDLIQVMKESAGVGECNNRMSEVCKRLLIF